MTNVLNLNQASNSDFNLQKNDDKLVNINKSKFTVSLAYAPSANEQWYMELKLSAGTTILDALQLTGWLDKDSELAKWCSKHLADKIIDNKHWRVGIYSQKQLLTYSLKENDRVEVYRPLTVDPMNKRKKRATKQ